MICTIPDLVKYPTLSLQRKGGRNRVSVYNLSGSSIQRSRGNWWDMFGEPQYGGRFTFRATGDVQSLDQYRGMDLLGVTGLVYETLGMYDWTLDRKIYDYTPGWTPDEYVTPCLSESWEMMDPYHQVFHIRKGVHFQYVSPVNGRELTADDVGWTFSRIIGCGYGFTEPTPYRGTGTYYYFKNIYSTDKYTLVFEFSKPTFDYQDTALNMYGMVQPW